MRRITVIKGAYNLKPNFGVTSTPNVMGCAIKVGYRQLRSRITKLSSTPAVIWTISGKKNKGFRTAVVLRPDGIKLRASLRVKKNDLAL